MFKVSLITHSKKKIILFIVNIVKTENINFQVAVSSKCHYFVKYDWQIINSNST